MCECVCTLSKSGVLRTIMNKKPVILLRRTGKDQHHVSKSRLFEKVLGVILRRAKFFEIPKSAHFGCTKPKFAAAKLIKVNIRYCYVINKLVTGILCLPWLLYSLTEDDINLRSFVLRILQLHVLYSYTCLFNVFRSSETVITALGTGEK